MHPGVYFACASVAAYLAYRELSRSPSVKPITTNSVIAHAVRAPNPVIGNPVTALTSVRAETDDQRRATITLLKKP